jgi:hypothetical protein
MLTTTTTADAVTIGTLGSCAHNTHTTADAATATKLSSCIDTGLLDTNMTAACCGKGGGYAADCSSSSASTSANVTADGAAAAAAAAANPVYECPIDATTGLPHPPVGAIVSTASCCHCMCT